MCIGPARLTLPRATRKNKKHYNTMNKKLFFMAVVAALTLAACSKQQEVGTAEASQEIVFQVARYKNATKADPADYKDDYQSVPFGAYAWYKGVSASDNADFMTNQPVGYDSGKNVWAPTGTTYYWPKSGGIDFICYSPYTADGVDAPLPTITESGISYPVWNVSTHPTVDVMYADKVTGLTNNTTTYYYNGVPTLFHHALAKVTFQIKQAYMSKTADTGDTTSWEITVNSISVANVLVSGTLDLTLNSDNTWKKPVTNVWDGTSGAREDINLLSTPPMQLDGTAQLLASDRMILPQSLSDGQKVVLNVTIKTYRDQNDGNGPQLVLTETGVNIEALLQNGELDRWGMNQNITYSFNIAPSLGTETTEDKDGDGIPDVEPTIVYFDPAVSDWENITVSAGINI